MTDSVTLCAASHPLRGEINIPSDKSISHRSIMFGAIAKGTTRIRHLLESADCLATVGCFRSMGIEIEQTKDEWLVHGKGLRGLSACDSLDAMNSGTTMRLISGILCGQQKDYRITGDASLCRRPMKRIMDPLGQMGASIVSEPGTGCAPLRISPAPLHGINYNSPVASAQVKSCILLAGLYADGPTQVTEPALSRDHTERMLSAFGANVTRLPSGAIIQPEPDLRALDIDVCGDISSAAYWMAAGLLVEGSSLLLKNVNTNPTRDGMLQVLSAMGADIEQLNERTVSGEPVADLLVKASPLSGTVVEGAVIPRLIDELPMIAVLAAFADGETIIRDARELRVKESDRIALVTENLTAMGADVEATEDGMIIHGGRPLHGAKIRTAADHRIAMAFSVAGLGAEGETVIDDGKCVGISYPTFYQTLNALL